MSTQSYTQDQPATSQHDTRRAPRPHRGQPPWYRTAAIAIGAVLRPNGSMAHGVG
jgi:hypothetical protein